MADTYKILGQSTTGDIALDNLTTKEVTVYEVPSNKKASISAIEITNTSNSTQTYSLSALPKIDTTNTVSVPYTLSNSTYDLIFGISNSRNIYKSTSQGNFINYGKASIEAGTGYQTAVMVGVANQKIFIRGGGPNEKTYWSEDGVTFTPINVVLSLHGVAYINNKYIGTDRNRTFFYESTNGTSWTTVSGLTLNGSSFTISSINFLTSNELNQLVAIVSLPGNVYSIMYSSNGKDWYTASTPSTPNTSDFYGARYLYFKDGYFIAHGTSNQVMYSTNGINWTNTNIGTLLDSIGATLYQSNIINGRIYVRSVSGGYIFNGLLTDSAGSYVQSTIPGNNFFGGGGIFFQNNYFIVMTNFGPMQLARSLDAITWTIYGEIGDTIYTPIQFDAKDLQQYQDPIPQSLNRNIIIKNKTIEPGETHEIKGGITLSFNDQIRALCASDELVVNVYGVEIS